jgi:H+-translocating NAD(P) transhydrogenase subunit alpha
VLGFTAVVCATMNVVGGFLITDRMLGMFKREAGRGKREEGSGSAAGDGRRSP